MGMEEKFDALQKECEQLREKLSQQNFLQQEVESLKDELETSLETHKRLQEVALAFEEENRSMNLKYNAELRERAKLDAEKLELTHEVESKKQSFENLEKRFKKLKNKLDENEDVQGLVYNLEKENRKKSERVNELQDQLQAFEVGRESKQKDLHEKIAKLTKDNTELNIKLETYIEEMEELDGKVESLEEENQLLKTTIKRVENFEMFGNCSTEVAELEAENKRLAANLQKEIEKRETVENELFKLEDEFESYKLQIEKYDDKETSTSDSLNNVKESTTDEVTDEDPKNLLRQKLLIIANLQGEMKEMSEKIVSLEQEHEILLEENSSLAKANLELKEKTNKCTHRFEQKITEMESEMKEMKSNRDEIEKKNFNRLLTSAEKELKMGEQQKMNEKLQVELKTVHEYLRLATDKNTELQGKLENVNRKAEEQLKKFEQEKKLVFQKHDQQIESLKEQDRLTSENNEVVFSRLTIQMDQERTEYQNRIMDLTLHIQSLEERLSAMRSFYEQKSNTSQSTPSPETTPPVAIRNGKLFDSMDDLDHVGTRHKITMDDDETGSLSDRELRRIAYKITSSNWSSLPTELHVHESDVVDILSNNTNDQEKVFRLLVCWRQQLHQPRCDQIKVLMDSIDPKRKDVIRFLKEMSGQPVKETNAIKTRFQKFKKSVKR